MGTTTAQPQTGDVTTRQLSDGNGLQGGGGTLLGINASDKIGFFGGPAVVQPSSTGSLRGAVGTVTVYATTQSPTSVAPNTAAEQALTVTGVATGQLVIVNKPTAQAGLALATARVSAANTIQVTFANDTAATITPTASETYIVTAIPANMLLTAVLSPVAVQPNTTAEQTFAVAGVGAGAAVAVNKPTAQAGLAILGARCLCGRPGHHLRQPDGGHDHPYRCGKLPGVRPGWHFPAADRADPHGSPHARGGGAEHQRRADLHRRWSAQRHARHRQQAEQPEWSLDWRRARVGGQYAGDHLRQQHRCHHHPHCG